MPDAPQAIAAVGAVVVDRDGRVLLVRRGRAPSAGSWTLPGGRIERGEAPEAAIARELCEETALAVRVVCTLGTVTIVREGTAYAIHEYLVVPVGGTAARAGDDAADVRWVARNEVEQAGVAAEAVDVLDRGLAEARSRGLVPRLQSASHPGTK